MKEFKKQIEKKLKFWTLICCLYPSVLIASKAIFKNANDFGQGVVFGACSGAMFVAIYFLLRNYYALHDEEKLKKLYVELTDERNKAIAGETMKTASVINVVIAGIACIVAGFINVTVSITLCADIILNVLITLAVQLYYKKKM